MELTATDQPLHPDASVPHLILGVMRHHVWVRDSLDDWAGVTDTTTRRKLQNKLHQRAHRHRKQLQKHGIIPLASGRSMPPRHDRIAACQNEISERCYQHTTLSTPKEYYVAMLRGLAEGYDTVDDCIGYRLFTSPEHRRYVQRVARQAYEAYTLSMPRPSHLQVLIRLNVLNAIAKNALLVGVPIESLCRDEMVSPFSCLGPYNADSPGSTGWSTCPVALRPTKLQREIPHHPWIDLLPFPKMRDNFLVVFEKGIFDEDELCTDLLDVNEDGADIEKASLVVWGDPWDPRQWEATWSFWAKWAWLMKGCTELFEATNYWRKLRGGQQINFTPLLE